MANNEIDENISNDDLPLDLYNGVADVWFEGAASFVEEYPAEVDFNPGKVIRLTGEAFGILGDGVELLLGFKDGNLGEAIVGVGGSTVGGIVSGITVRGAVAALSIPLAKAILAAGAIAGGVLIVGEAAKAAYNWLL